MEARKKQRVPNFWVSSDMGLLVLFMADEEAGKFFKAICAYAQSEDVEAAKTYLPNDEKSHTLFKRACEQVDEGFYKFRARSEAGRKAASTRWSDGDEDEEELTDFKRELGKRGILV